MYIQLLAVMVDSLEVIFLWRDSFPPSHRITLHLVSLCLCMFDRFKVMDKDKLTKDDYVCMADVTLSPIVFGTRVYNSEIEVGRRVSCLVSAHRLACFTMMEERYPPPRRPHSDREGRA